MIDRVRVNGALLYYDAWKGIPVEDLRSIKIHTTITADLESAGIMLSQAKDYVWVIDLKSEGLSPEDLDHAFHWLINDVGLPRENFRVIFSCLEDRNLPYPYVSITDRLIYNGNWFWHLEQQNIDWQSMARSQSAVCLMRSPTMSRAWIAKKLYKSIDLSRLVISLGTNGSRHSDAYADIIKPHPYPIIADDQVVSSVAQHRLSHTKFYQPYVNLVVESSSQIDVNYWHSIFITEKSYKALAWHQFPLWYAVPGTVALVREQGFDVFDDLFEDHAYDSEQDPWRRMDMVVALLNRFMKQDLAVLAHEHWNRIQSNAALVREIHTFAQSRHEETINGLLTC